MQKLASPRGGVTGLTFSPDGDMLAGVGADVLYCWTRSRGWEQSGLRHPLHQIASAVFHPTGRALVYGLVPTPRGARAGADDEFAGFAGVRLYSLTEEPLFEPDRLAVSAGAFSPFPYNWLAGAALTPDGRTLVASQFEDRGFFSRAMPVILHWHLAASGGKWKAEADAPTRTEVPEGAAFLGEFLVLAGKWGIRLCPFGSPGEGPVYAPKLKDAQAVAAAPRGGLVAASEGGKLRVWSVQRPEPVSDWPTAAVPVSALAFSPDGRVLAVGDTERAVAFYDPSRGRGTEYDFGVGPVQSLAYAPDGLTLAVAGKNGLVVVDVE
jgi:WD40 repeat protein